jgi:Domain of unknown function (DUF222)
MPRQAPEPDPGDEQAAASTGSQPQFTWVPGSTGTGPVPTGLGLDGQALLDGLAAGGFLDGGLDDQDAVVAEEQAAAEDRRMSPPLPAGQAAALAVEHMPPGPAQAGWLAAAAQAKDLDEYELTGVATGARQLASWAQSVELAAVAQLSAVTAKADPDVGLKPDGRPARLCRDAVGQVSLALMLTDQAASDWAGLAVAVTWRLPATGAALADGRIDVLRAKVIAEATSVLGEDAARAVEAQILPGAGRQTAARLRARLRRAVIAADPEGAERRREQAERLARVCLYGEADGTATLAGTGLPAVEAAAAMARITAIAKAKKAAGQAGGLDLHRAQVMLGLLLGTLPYIPPPGGAPEPPPPSDPGRDDPGDSHPGGPGDDSTVRPGPQADDGPGGHNPGQGEPLDDPPAPRDEDAPEDDGPDQAAPGGPDDNHADGEDGPGSGPAPPWPALGVIPPALARPARNDGGRPVPGLLDLTLPWATLAGLSAAPGVLGRIGPITAAQARHLATAAAADPAAQWRIIVTSPAGQAITVTRIPRRHTPDRSGQARHGPAPPGHDPPPGTGLAGRITLTITADTVREYATGPGSGPAAGPGPPPIAAAALRAAARALDRAQAQADTAAGGCAHAGQSPAYQPPPRLREQITARDLTCRYPTCRQPAWRADLDHTIPYDRGGRTCSCNLGGACRRHHQLKQHPRWTLEQTRPGYFTWTTPAGRTYTTGPDTHPV